MKVFLFKKRKAFLFKKRKVFLFKKRKVFLFKKDFTVILLNLETLSFLFFFFFFSSKTPKKGYMVAVSFKGQRATILALLTRQSWLRKAQQLLRF